MISLTCFCSFQAAVIGLAIHEGAYMAEIVRNGLQAVARGQIEAARSLGMSAWQVTWRIVIPQATRVIMPPTCVATGEAAAATSTRASGVTT